MHKVERAIIMAAGIGKRMQPVTLYTPKPMVKVNGIRMIDTVIRGLHQNGIYEIYVVVGHLKAQFRKLEKEYEGVQLIENPYYAVCNNISSLYVARDHIENAIIPVSYTHLGILHPVRVREVLRMASLRCRRMRLAQGLKAERCQL